jgi:putative phage-type endonuclease
MGFEVIGDSRDRAEWLELRKLGLGGSDAPQALGLSPYGSQATLYLDKTTPEVEDDGASPVTELGQFLEPFTLKKVAELYDAQGYELDRLLYRNTERPWQLCTLDGMVYKGTETIRAEMKTRAFDDEWQDSVPADILCQVQHQIDVMGVDRMLLGVLFRVSGEAKWVEIERDEKFITKVLRPETEKFWRKVEARDSTDLAVDGSKATAKALAALYPEQEDAAEKVLAGDFLALADELEAIREGKKGLEERAGLIRNKIAAAIGAAPVGRLSDGRRFNYKTVNRKGYSVAPTSYRAVTGPFGKPI